MSITLSGLLSSHVAKLLSLLTSHFTMSHITISYGQRFIPHNWNIVMRYLTMILHRWSKHLIQWSTMILHVTIIHGLTWLYSLLRYVAMRFHLSHSLWLNPIRYSVRSNGYYVSILYFLVPLSTWIVHHFFNSTVVSDYSKVSHPLLFYYAIHPKLKYACSFITVPIEFSL